MKFTDNRLINADYWNRTKIILVLIALFYGTGSMLLGHQKLGAWLLAAGATLLLLMLAQKCFHSRAHRQEPARAKERETLDKWSVSNWRFPFVLVLILFSVGFGAWTKFNLHRKSGEFLMLTGAILILTMVLHWLFPDRPKQLKPKPEDYKITH